MQIHDLPSYTVVILMLAIIAIRCGASVTSNLLKLSMSRRENKPSDRKQILFASLGLFIIILEVAFVGGFLKIDNCDDLLAKIGPIGIIVGFSIHAAGLVGSNGTKTFPWTRFLIKDILQSTTLLNKPK